MTAPEAERILNELRKQNKECLNCLSVSKVGHGNVCVPFKTFVCRCVCVCVCGKCSLAYIGYIGGGANIELN